MPDNDLATYQKAFDRYCRSPDFIDGVIAATKTAWGGGQGGYSSVIFYADGTWQHVSSENTNTQARKAGLTIPLPTIADSVLAGCMASNQANFVDMLRQTFHDSLKTLVST